jgi:hypothetical protein
MMIGEYRALVECQLEGDKPKAQRIIFPPSANLSTINPIWNTLKLNPDLCSEKLATNCLISYMTMFLCVVIDHSGFCVGYEDFTAVSMKNAVFWDMTPCGPLEVH